MSEGEVIGLCTTGVASARNIVDPTEVRDLLKSARNVEPDDDYDPETHPVDPDAELRTALDNATGVSLSALYGFRDAARHLKATEAAYRVAQQQYAEAVKRLSEEAVK